MKKKMMQIYKNNKPMVWAAAVAIILTLGILVVVKDEVTRFTLIMPVFAGFILFSILTTEDDEEELTEEKSEAKKKSPKK